MAIVARPFWPAYKCSCDDPNYPDVHTLMRDSEDVAYCTGCFRHFKLSEFEDAKWGAVFMELRRRKLDGLYRGGLN